MIPVVAVTMRFVAVVAVVATFVGVMAWWVAVGPGDEQIESDTHRGRLQALKQGVA